MTTGYDNPKLRSYHFAAHDFGTGSNITQVIAVPKTGRDLDNPGTGARGRVRGVLISAITEDFAGSTTDAGVQVGDGSDADLYFDSGLVLDETADIAESVYLLDDGAAVDIPGGRSTVTITTVAATGTPTGIANVDVEIEWFDV